MKFRKSELVDKTVQGIKKHCNKGANTQWIQNKLLYIDIDCS